MNKTVLLIASGVAAFLSQVWVFDYALLFGALNPYPYFFWILLLPPDFDKRLLLALAFLLGLGVDAFNDTGGLHAAACTAIAFARPWFIRLIATQGGLEFERLGLYDLGFRRFAVYAGIATLAHHFLLYTLEAFSWRLMGRVLLFTVVGGILTFLVALLILLPFRKTISSR